MIFTTVNAIKEIKKSDCKNVLLDGHSSGILNAMTFSLKYHSLDIKKGKDKHTLIVNGIKPVPTSMLQM
jgi:hypothetical protein